MILLFFFFKKKIIPPSESNATHFKAGIKASINLFFFPVCLVFVVAEWINYLDGPVGSRSRSRSRETLGRKGRGVMVIAKLIAEIRWESQKAKRVNICWFAVYNLRTNLHNRPDESQYFHPSQFHFQVKTKTCVEWSLFQFMQLKTPFFGRSFLVSGERERSRLDCRKRM